MCSERVAAAFDRIRVGLVLLSHLLELSKMTDDSLRDVVTIHPPQRTQWQFNGPRVAAAVHAKNSGQQGFVWCQLHYPSRRPALMCWVARKKALSTRRRCGKAAVISERAWAYGLVPAACQAQIPATSIYGGLRNDGSANALPRISVNSRGKTSVERNTTPPLSSRANGLRAGQLVY